MTPQPTLTSLANTAAWKALEDRWLTVIEESDVPRNDLLEALAIMNKSGRGQQAAALGWTWLATERERSSPAELLALGRELIIRCGDNGEMRKEILRLYEEVFADRPEIKRLIDASGLRGGKSPRRALRTLEICLALKEGDALVARADEHVAKVLAIDADACEYTLKTKRGELTLDADALALAYDPVAANDFRVLKQINPDQIRNMLDADAVALVIGVLQSHRGRLDSDQLEHLLCPNFLTPQNWPGWWNKAKTALKRCSNVIVEGRNPVILTYNAQGQTLENEIEPQWARAETPAQRLAVVETYFREAKARHTDIKPAMVKRFHKDLQDRVNAARKGSPLDAIMEAIIIDRLVELGKLSAEVSNPARAILEECPDLIRLLKQIPETTFFLRAAEMVRAIRPDDWAQIYAEVLPFAPAEGCDMLAKALDQAGKRDLLDKAVQRIPTNFTQHMDALCWLWRVPSVQGLDPLSARELLLKLLGELAELTRNDYTPADLLRDARLKVRAALGVAKFSRYREVIEGMDASLASTVRRTVERLDGLGQVVRATLLRIIQETHPELYLKAKIDPWLDESIIFGTQPGMTKREEELNFLVNVKMKENAKAIGDAAAHGDLSENSEYKFALEERDLLRARVAAIQNELSLARLITINDVQTDIVNVGTRVTLASTDGVNCQDMTILGPWEADIEKGIYNYRAPLCTKLKGLKVGDVARLDLDGTEREYRIEAIANALENQTH